MTHIVRVLPQLHLVKFLVEYRVHCLAKLGDGKANKFHILQTKKGSFEKVKVQIFKSPHTHTHGTWPVAPFPFNLISC